MRDLKTIVENYLGSTGQLEEVPLGGGGEREPPAEANVRLSAALHERLKFSGQRRQRGFSLRQAQHFFRFGTDESDGSAGLDGQHAARAGCLQQVFKIQPGTSQIRAAAGHSLIGVGSLHVSDNTPS